MLPGWSRGGGAWRNARGFPIWYVLAGVVARVSDAVTPNDAVSPPPKGTTTVAIVGQGAK